MVIRDLTLRSAASFGSFHLIRLLYDEYMFYIVEQRVAEALNKTAVAVMAMETLSTNQYNTGVLYSTKFHTSMITFEGESKNIAF